MRYSPLRSIVCYLFFCLGGEVKSGLVRLTLVDMAERILVVDDDPRICKLLVRFLTSEGYKVKTSADGRQMRCALASDSFDLVIMDLKLPGGENGLTLAQHLRASSDIPIIMLTGKSDFVDKVVGLELGADDYVTKPFERRELLARIRSVLRRSKTQPIAMDVVPHDQATILFSGWTLDLMRHELTTSEGEMVNLTSYEYVLLSFMAQRPGSTISRDQILDVVASREWHPNDRSVDVLVGNLRRKLNDNPRNPRVIKTVRGAGYMFAVPMKNGSDAPDDGARR